jgi:SAM-dependent methyltransferase
LDRLKEAVKTIPVLPWLWGKIRWYTSSAGMRQMISAIAYKFSNLGANAVECPICGWHGRVFMSAGTIPRANAKCPRCKSLERHRLLCLYLQNEWIERLNQPTAVLEIGSGEYSYKLFSHYPIAKYVTTDLFSPQAMIRSDVTALPFQSSAFDLVVCYHVLMYVPDDRRAMEEMHRVLKPDGVLLSSEPVKNAGSELLANDFELSAEDRVRRFDGGYRIYGTALVERLTATGFSVHAYPYASRLDKAIQERHRLLADDMIYVCKKS